MHSDSQKRLRQLYIWLAQIGIFFELNSGLRISVLYGNNISFTEQLSVQLRVLCVGQLVAALLAPPRPRVPGPGVGVEPGLALELETKVHAKGIIMEKA